MNELLTERRGSIAVFTLNRPDSLNAFNTGLLQALQRGLDEVARDRTVRALVLTGAGGRAFSAGADLKERRTMSEEEVRAFVPLIRDTFTRIANLPQPTVAAVNGFAFGGGTELALACDLRVVDAGAVMGLTEVTLAIIPGAGGTQRLPRLIGVARAKQMILTGEKINAEEAWRIGLANSIAGPEGALEAAVSLAERIARNGPVAVRAAKRAIDRGMDLPMEEALDLELACYQDVIPTTDRREALVAFAEKRAPQYRGE